MFTHQISIRKLFSYFVLLLISLSFSLIDKVKESEIKFGVIDDSYMVNNLGAYNHTLPLDLPKGINGLKPTLSIFYDSRAGLSELGIGWSLTGISSIKRGGNNIAQNGRNKGITFSAKDNFLLDGQYLTIVSGDKGQNDSSYRTESESFKKIYAIHKIDKSNSSPKTFVVKSPDGLTYTYGYHNNSNDGLDIIKLGENHNEVLEWRIKEIKDPYGNFIRFNYEQHRPIEVSDDAVTIKRIQSIIYAGNLANSNYYSNAIYFKYDDDWGKMRKSNENFIAGVKFINNNVLKQIAVKVDGEDFRYYHFSYDKSYSKLTEIHESTDEDNKVRLRPTKIEYNEPNKLDFFKKRDITIPYLGVKENVYRESVDLDLDGNLENLVFTNNSTNTHLELQIYGFENDIMKPIQYENNYDILVEKMDSIESNYNPVDFGKILGGDFNGDGYLDFLSKNKLYRNKFLKTKEIGFDTITVAFEHKENNFFNCTNCERSIHDFNEDGRDEIVVVDNTKKELKIYSLKNDTPSFHVQIFKDFNTSDSHPRTLNFNQSASSLVFVESDGNIKYLQWDDDETDNTIVLREGSFPKLNGGYLWDKLGFHDFNFDGLEDLYVTNGKSISVAINEGSLKGKPKFRNFEEKKNISTNDLPNNLYWGNFTNSGLLELLLPLENKKFEVLSFGFSNSELKIKPIDNPTDLIKFSDDIDLKKNNITFDFKDINGDGVVDLSIFENSIEIKNGKKAKRTDYINETNFINRLNSVTDGFGNVVNVDYTTTKNNWVYSFTNSDLKDSKYQYYQSPYVIVNKIEFSNGLKDGLNSINYKYEDLIYERTGRGLSGFRKFTEVNNTTEIVDEKTYHFEFPLTGKIIENTRKLRNGKVFFQQKNTWDVMPYQKDVDFTPLEEFAKANDGDTFEISQIEIPRNKRALKKYFKKFTFQELKGNINEKLIFSQLPDKHVTTKIIIQALKKFNETGIRYLPYLQATQVIKWDIDTKSTITSDSNIEYKYNNFGNVVKKETSIGNKTIVDSTLYEQKNSNFHNAPYLLGLPKYQHTYVINQNNDQRTKPRVFNFEYNKIGKIEIKIREKTNDSLKHVTKYTYDKFGNTTSVKKFRDSTNFIQESYVYSKEGRFLISTIKADTSHIINYRYDKLGRLKYVIGSNNDTLEKIYDSFGRIFKEIQPNNNYSKYNFEFLKSSDYSKIFVPDDAIYKLTTSSNSRSDIYTYFDSQGREVSSLYQLIDTIAYPNKKPDNLSILEKIKRRNQLEGVTKRFVFSMKSYDEKGNVHQVSNPRYLQLTYDSYGKLLCAIPESEDVKTIYTYDGINRLKSVLTPDNIEFTTKYEGNSKTEKNEKTKIYTTTIYNELGEVIKILDSKNNPVNYIYDLWGNVIKIEGLNGYEILTEYDHVGRKKYVHDSSIGKIEYIYDEFDRLVEEKSQSKVTNISYDVLSRIVKKISDDRKIIWVYDKKYKGNTDYIAVYDKDGEQKSKEFFDYDYLGNVKKVSHVIDSITYYTSFYYDEYYRISEKAQGIVERSEIPEFKLKYGYVNDIVTTIKKDSGEKIYEISALDALGNVRVKSFGNGVKSYISIDGKTGLTDSIKTYKPTVELISLFDFTTKPCFENPEIDNSLNTSPDNFPIDYDPSTPNGPLGPNGPRNSGQQLNKANTNFVLTAMPKTTNTLQDLKFEYDSNYNLTRRINKHTDTTDVYGYDDLNRIKSHQVFYNNVEKNSTDYNIDFNGNIRRIGNKDLNYFNSKHPHRIQNVRKNNEGKLFDFRYDDYGNIDTIIKPEKDTISIAYSSFNKPTHIKSNKGEQSFIYGNSNQQIKTELNRGELITITPFPDFEIIKENNSETTYRYYVVLNGELVAISNRQGNRSSNFYAHKDNLGNIDLVTNDSGVDIKRCSYDPYGKRNISKNEEDSFKLTKGFTGHQHLDNFGLINMGGRFYIPEIGRFLSPDPYIQNPSNLQSLNRYSYVLNNPMNLVDPSGFWGIKIRIRVKWNPLKDVEKGIRNTGRAIAKAHEDVYNEADRFVNKYGKQIAMVAAAAAITYFSAGMASGWAAASIQGAMSTFWGATLSGAAWGAGISATITAVNGGNFNDIMDAAFNGAISGATAAAASSSIGLGFDTMGLAGSGGHILTHGVSGGLQSEINGGNFEEGFWSASISKAFVPSNETLFGRHPDDAFKRIAYSAAIGGLTSHVQGGNVMQGALTAGFIQQFNQENQNKRFYNGSGNLVVQAVASDAMDMREAFDAGDNIRGFGGMLSTIGKPLIGACAVGLNPVCLTGYGIYGAGKIMQYHNEINNLFHSPPPRNDMKMNQDLLW